MDKRFYLAIGGILIVILAALWLTKQPDQPAVSGNALPAAQLATATPASAEPGPTPQAGNAGEVVSQAMPPTATQLGAAQPEMAKAEALPIDVSPGFEYLSKPATEMKDTDSMWSLWRRHQQLQSEPRDEEWAPRMEAALREAIQDSLTKRGVDTQRIELPVVECRTNGCEIQALGYTEDNGKQGVDLQFILPGVLSGSLGSEFDRDGYSIMLSTRRIDQRVTFLAQLSRKKQ